VEPLARLAELNAQLEPLARRAERLRDLDEAVALEDSSRAAPLDPSDPVEEEVRQWFASDGELARRYVAEGDEAIQERRSEGRAQIRQRLRDEMETLSRSGQERMAAAGDVEAAARPCQNAIFVRSAVLEACETIPSPVCEDARAAEAGGRVRFVEAPEDLWYIEEFRPWADATSLGVNPAGGIGGARTSARARRANVILVVSVEPMIRDRSGLTEEQASEFDANLDSLGISFEHPDFVMAPALGIQLEVTEPLGGETHYLLHFGELSEPANELIWSTPASEGGPFRAVFAAAGAALARLQAGEVVSLTAVRVPEGENPEGEAVFTLSVPSVNQARTVSALLSYMASGELGRDLAALVPPSDPGSR
jgi:hypothetical protein